MSPFRRLLRLAFASLVVLAALGVAGIVVVLAGLDDFDLSGHKARDLSFANAGWTLSGTLYTPGQTRPRAGILLVHGDGPQDRLSDGGYLPLMRTLLDAGFAVYSWDKPGIGQSEGNWLDQSMADRAAEVAEAVAALRKAPELAGVPVGTLGFSQAGWVLPKVAALKEDGADFHVLVGGAVNWQRQGAYYTTQRLKRAGKTESEIAARLAQQRMDDDRLLLPGYGYEDYLKDFQPEDPMSEARFGFVVRNMNADSTADFAGVTGPFLTLHGDSDLNVDPVYNPAEYGRLLKGKHPASKSVVIENGTHGLLDARFFNYQLPSDMPVWSRNLFLALGRRAYADGALDTITDWITDRVTVR